MEKEVGPTLRCGSTTRGTRRRPPGGAIRGWKVSRLMYSVSTCWQSGLSAAEIYLEVQSSPLREVRCRYRRPVARDDAFLLWYIAYVIAATTAHDLMARPVEQCN